MITPTDFYREEEIIVMISPDNGVKIATCNQWAKETIDEFIEKVNSQKLEFVITAL